MQVADRRLTREGKKKKELADVPRQLSSRSAFSPMTDTSDCRLLLPAQVCLHSPSRESAGHVTIPFHLPASSPVAREAGCLSGRRGARHLSSEPRLDDWVSLPREPLPSQSLARLPKPFWQRQMPLTHISICSTVNQPAQTRVPARETGKMREKNKRKRKRKRT